MYGYSNINWKKNYLESNQDRDINGHKEIKSEINSKNIYLFIGKFKFPHITWNEEGIRTSHKPLEMNDQWVLCITEPGRCDQCSIRKKVILRNVSEKKKKFNM